MDDAHAANRRRFARNRILFWTFGIPSVLQTVLVGATHWSALSGTNSGFVLFVIFLDLFALPTVLGIYHVVRCHSERRSSFLFSALLVEASVLLCFLITIALGFFFTGELYNLFVPSNDAESNIIREVILKSNFVTILVVAISGQAILFYLRWRSRHSQKAVRASR